MDDTLTLDDLIAILRRLRIQIEQHQDWLSELDSLGDADHGVSMTIAARAIDQALATTSPTTIGVALSLAARVFLSEVGGAVGPLYGTAFLRGRHRRHRHLRRRRAGRRHVRGRLPRRGRTRQGSAGR